MGSDQRESNALRPIRITRQFTCHAEGSVLIEMGQTRVLCTASVSDRVPRFLAQSDQGWVTAEYGMLPRSTGERMDREAVRGKQSGRTVEIQRLIGRSLRQAIDLKAIRGLQIQLDCDVLQADGGTRCAAINGACVALYDALKVLQSKKVVHTNPWKHWISAVSVGIHNGVCVLDLDYGQDSTAETDMNVIMNDAGGFVELQGTAEKGSFTAAQMQTMMGLAADGTSLIRAAQLESVGLSAED